LDDAEANPDLYDKFVGVAVAEAIRPNAASYCWYASRRQAMVENAWAAHGALVHQQIIWAKPRGVALDRSALTETEALALVRENATFLVGLERSIRSATVAERQAAVRRCVRGGVVDSAGPRASISIYTVPVGRGAAPSRPWPRPGSASLETILPFGAGDRRMLDGFPRPLVRSCQAA
jgi:hypothetical protein